MTNKGTARHLAGEQGGPRSHINYTTVPDGDMLPVTIDGQHFSSKPRGEEIAGITRRMQAAGVTWLSAAELGDHIKAGGTWCTGYYLPRPDGWGEYLGARVFALDFDDGLLGPDAAVLRAIENGLHVVAIYPTFGSTPAALRYRLVIDGGAVIEDEGTAMAVLAWLLRLYPEADQKCRNLNRLWFGSPGELYPLPAV